MIIEFFLSCFLISVLLIILGSKLDFTLGIIGGIVLFMTGIGILYSPLTIHTTDTITTSYSYLNATTGVLNWSNESHTPNYSTFDTTLPATNTQINHLLGILFAIGGVASIAAMVIHRQK